MKMTILLWENVFSPIKRSLKSILATDIPAPTSTPPLSELGQDQADAGQTTTLLEGGALVSVCLI